MDRELNDSDLENVCAGMGKSSPSETPKPRMRTNASSSASSCGTSSTPVQKSTTATGC